MPGKKNILNFLENSVSGHIGVDEQVKFLANFSPEKINSEHLRIFANFMFRNMKANLKMPGAMDICGTGGSGLPRINTSTIASFILAELGVKVAKHGNKAASGRFGSFDLLESLGLEIDKTPLELEKIYRDKGLAFVFARNFHPVMKFFAEARKTYGKPTIFNILGPMLNPAMPKIQIIGTSFKNLMRLIAESCRVLGKKSVMVVRGRDGLDEVTLTDRTDVVELKDGKILEYSVGPEDFGLESVKFEKIAGGDEEFNKKTALKILSGKCISSHADLVYVNCAVALKMLGMVEDYKQGYRLAKSAVGLVKLEAYKGDILAEIAASKIVRRSAVSFPDALASRRSGGVRAVIAEIKFASPSKGKICKGKIGTGTAAKIAKIYQKYGASAVSVLTDEKYFKGSFEFLKIVKKNTSLPVLCKDFIISEYQIYKAMEYGADAILLITTLLPEEKLKKFIVIAESLEMAALVEVHDEEELYKALKAGAKIIGINNRNLKDFMIDLETTNTLVKKIPDEIIIVSESGFESRKDLIKLDKRVDAVLIGTSLMQAKNISKKIHEFT